MQFATVRSSLSKIVKPSARGGVGSVAKHIRTKVTMAGPAEDQGARPIRLAVLHQAIEPPVIGGVRKAMKPGGYKDSSADIAYVLRQHSKTDKRTNNNEPEIDVLTPRPNPEPMKDEGWSFSDAESSILSAIHEQKVTHFWANTILFASHPLQTVRLTNDLENRIYMVGQPPNLVEKYDDKNWVNKMLRNDPILKLPRSWVVNLDDILGDSSSLQDHLAKLDLPYPVVGKPIRGRGSHGVKLCKNLNKLTSHLEMILAESPQIMIEEYLAGQEGTVTVMPPSTTNPNPRYWALPIVERFNHADGVAPYNGVVAVLQNSRVVPLDQQDFHLTANGEIDFEAAVDTDNAYVDVRRQSETVAEKLGCTAPIRVDVRRRKEGDGSASDNPFVMFDVNMKPNMTGPGRPGRENQASLTAMAAEALGWDYTRLLQEMLKTAQPLRQVRYATLPQEWD